MQPKMDHVIVLVKNLEQAVKNYEDLGFRVSTGGDLGGARNAIIPFSDGTYLELMSVSQGLAILCRTARTLGFFHKITSGRTPMEKRFMKHFAKEEGLVDFAILSDAIEQDIDHVRQQGIEMEGPVTGSRVQSDGSELHFRWGIPQDDLPFLIRDETSRDKRVPGGSSREHPNGVQGIAMIEVVVPDLSRYVDLYTALPGIEATSSDNTADTNRADFKSGSVMIRLLQPEAGDRERQRYLKKRGASPYSLQLKTDDPSYTGTLDQAKTRTKIELLSQ
ncbi:MAG: VOC family protein [Bacillaceae bacterium]|nr:VOC family protein [Bacillaceae bacterium]